MRFLPQRDGWPSRMAVMEHAPIIVTVKAGRIIRARLFESLPVCGKAALASYRTGENFSCEGGDGREPEVIWAKASLKPASSSQATEVAQ